MLVSTDRLFLREMVQAWLDKQLQNYRDHGFGLWAVILKETEEIIGQCGLTLQEYNGMTVSGTFSKKYRYYKKEQLHLFYSVINPNRS